MVSAFVIGSVLFAVGTVGLLARRDVVGRRLSAALAVQAIVLTAVAIASARGIGVATGNAIVLLIALLLELGALRLVGRSPQSLEHRQLDVGPDAIATSETRSAPVACEREENGPAQRDGGKS